MDDLLPVRDGPEGQKQLVYGHCPDRQLWVALIEKAYAKLMGSYAAIVAGQTCQAMLELTGAPCESIDFEKGGVDPELMWMRLLSFR